MFTQIIALVSEKLGVESPVEVEFDEEALKLELEILTNIQTSVLGMELEPDADPVETIKASPNVLLFKDEEGAFLATAIESQKLINQLIQVNTPRNPIADAFEDLANDIEKEQANQTADAFEELAKETEDNGVPAEDDLSRNFPSSADPIEAEYIEIEDDESSEKE